MDDAQIIVVQIKDENRAALARIAASSYLGMQCGYCGVRFETIEDLGSAVRDLDDPEAPGLRIAHGSCYRRAVGP
jgi:hypothetical protein